MKMQETVLKLMKSRMKIVFGFLHLRKTKIANRPKIAVTGGKGKTGSGATANKMAVALVVKECCVSSSSRDCSGNIAPTARNSNPKPACIMAETFSKK